MWEIFRTFSRHGNKLVMWRMHRDGRNYYKAGHDGETVYEPMPRAGYRSQRQAIAAYDEQEAMYAAMA